MGYSGDEMLIGQHEHSLDAKNRVTLPARLRERFAAGAVAAPGLDGCLAIYPRDAWEAFVDARLAGLDPMSRDARAMARLLFGRAVELEPDKQGRLQLAPHLVQHAGLGRSVVFAGMRDHLELWDATRWTSFVEEAERDVAAIAEGIATTAKDQSRG